MSDPSQIINNSIALTSDLQYTLKPSAPKSRSYRLSVPALNKSTFQANDSMIFEIPVGRGRNVYLDQSQSYLKFNMQCVTNVQTTGNTVGSTSVSIENTAYSFFQRLDVYHGSNLLETINEYGQLSNFLIDTSLSQSDKASLSSLIGSNHVLGMLNTGAAYTQNVGPTFLTAPGDRSGQNISTHTSLTTAPVYCYSLPILSGVIGTLSSKCLPIGGLTGAPIRCEFYLSSNDDAIYYGGGVSSAVWTLTNVEMELCYIEINDDSLNLMNETEYISSQSYRHASTYLPNNTSGETVSLLPFKCASLKSLYVRARPFVNAVMGNNASSCYRKSASINPNWSQVSFRLGQTQLPNKPIYLTQNGSGSEGFAELLKSFHALSSSIGNSSITYDQYNVAATATNGWLGYYPPASQQNNRGTHNNAFAVGIECESFSNRSDTILSGISTLNTQIYFNAMVTSGQTVGGTNNLNYTLDFFSCMDIILVIQDGIMSCKY